MYVFKDKNNNTLHKATKIIVIFIEKKLLDYKNSHIFAVKD